MKALIMTNEYPPKIYGGAGVHVDYLSRELAKLCSVDVRCFGDQYIKKKKFSVTGFEKRDNFFAVPKRIHPIFSAVQRCLDFNSAGIKADVVHVHTWYTHLAGIMAKLNYATPLVITAHSLEPLRPWKRDQLSNGYDFSCWVEQTAFEMADAIIAVSKDARKDILNNYRINPSKIHIIHNGIDLNEYKPIEAPHLIRSLGIDPQKPYVLFIGRITRQKGITHFVNAIRYMDAGYQVVVCASSPDTPEIAAEVQSHIREIQKQRNGVIWVREMIDIPMKAALYSHASVFCCPSVYEPFGIINLEAMACETPVVASAVGGITEVVVDGETGMLVPCQFKRNGSNEPAKSERFDKRIAENINLLMKNKSLRLKMGKAGRLRAVKHFGWPAIAKRTLKLYKSLV